MPYSAVQCQGEAQKDVPSKKQIKAHSVGTEPIQVVVTDIHMSFTSMVSFMVKWAFAAIPAAILIGVVILLLSSVLGGLTCAGSEILSR